MGHFGSLDGLFTRGVQNGQQGNQGQERLGTALQDGGGTQFGQVLVGTNLSPVEGTVEG